MVELELVRRMLRRGLLLGPGATLAAYLLGSSGSAAAVALGIALALANLWLAGRVLGGLAENHPELLLAGALGTFVLGLAALSGAALALRRVDGLDLPSALLALLATHLVLVTWQAADSFLRLPKSPETSDPRPAPAGGGAPAVPASSTARRAERS